MRREVNVTLITGAFIFIWKGKDWCPGTGIPPLLTFSLQVLLGTHLCVAFAETTSFFGMEDEFESERK